MQQHVYKHRRKVKGKLKVDRCYTGRFKLSGDLKQTSIALNVTDKQVAERMLAKIVEEEQSEELVSLFLQSIRLTLNLSKTIYCCFLMTSEIMAEVKNI